MRRDLFACVIRAAKMNGLLPGLYLRDVLPAQLASIPANTMDDLPPSWNIGKQVALSATAYAPPAKQAKP
jgi:hypothetical protein